MASYALSSLEIETLSFVTETLTTHAYDRLPKRVCHLLNLVAGTAKYGESSPSTWLAFATNSFCYTANHSCIIAVQVQRNTHLRETRQFLSTFAYKIQYVCFL
jgi:hypothetical protein